MFVRNLRRVDGVAGAWGKSGEVGARGMRRGDRVQRWGEVGLAVERRVWYWYEARKFAIVMEGGIFGPVAEGNGIGMKATPSFR